MQRRIRFNRWGLAEDPKYLHVTWTVCERTYLTEVTEAYQTPMLGMWMLRTKYMDGSPAPDVAASAVKVLVRNYEEVN